MTTAPAAVPGADGLAVLVPPGLVRPVMYALMRESKRSYQDDGVTISDELRQLLQALRDADLANAAPVSSAGGSENPVLDLAVSSFVSCETTAKTLGVTARWARHLAQSGELEGATKINGWVIPAASLRLAVATRYRRRRPTGSGRRRR